MIGLKFIPNGAIEFIIMQSLPGIIRGPLTLQLYAEDPILLHIINPSEFIVVIKISFM